MTSVQPSVIPSGLYESKAACEALGITRQTLHNYTRRGLCTAMVRKSNGRMVWTGKELINLWRLTY